MTNLKIVIEADNECLTVSQGETHLTAQIEQDGTIEMHCTGTGIYKAVGNLDNVDAEARPLREGDRVTVLQDQQDVGLGTLDEFVHLLQMFNHELQRWLPKAREGTAGIIIKTSSGNLTDGGPLPW